MVPKETQREWTDSMSDMIRNTRETWQNLRRLLHEMRGEIQSESQNPSAAAESTGGSADTPVEHASPGFFSGVMGGLGTHSRRWIRSVPCHGHHYAHVQSSG